MTNLSTTEQLSIGEVAKRAGVRPSALRYYESVNLLPPPHRVNGRRCYEESIFQRIALVQLAQKAGFTVAEMQTFFHGFASDTPPALRWQTLAHKKMAEIDELLARAQQMKQILEQALQCDCLQLEDCVTVMDISRWNSTSASAI